MKSLRDRIVLSKNTKHTIEIVVDKIPVLDMDPRRLGEAVESAVDLSNGLVVAAFHDGEEITYSTQYSCPNDGFAFPEIDRSYDYRDL